MIGMAGSFQYESQQERIREEKAPGYPRDAFSSAVERAYPIGTGEDLRALGITMRRMVTFRY